MSLFTRFFSRSAWPESVNFSVLISSPIEHSEANFLGKIFDTVIIRDSDDHGLNVNPYRKNIVSYELKQVRPTETSQSLSPVSRAQWLDLKNFRVLLLFDSTVLCTPSPDQTNRHLISEYATRIFIGEYTTDLRVPEFVDVSEIVKGPNILRSRSGIFVHDLSTPLPLWVERPEFVIIEYNESNKIRVAEMARAGIQKHLFESRSGLEPY